MAQGDAQTASPRRRARAPGGVQGNFPQLIRDARDTDERQLRVMFMDEARFGRINRPVRCWAPGGTRPVVDCQTVREYLYAYGAVCPADGDLVSLVLASMHTVCFELFCAEIAARHPKELVVLVCDGAASHTTAELALPENMRIVTLPPYSPELNPTEQLWDLIRERAFSNVAHDSIDAVEDTLVAGLRALEGDPDTIRSLTHRAWITNPTTLTAG
ncbi:MAG: IS630 family transposase [Actinobacteria bacterium]|nr:IS630 family transposase [Actinomycetota bacterium]